MEESMSENTKHTPGPWTVEPRKCGFGFWVMTQDKAVCEIMHDDKSEADARLISAAPDLLAALQGLNYYGEIGNGFCCCPRQNWQDPDDLHSTACLDARKALRKAEGRA